jgi:uncharacterized protein
MERIQDIKTILERHKQQLYKKYPIKSMAIFGSFARNEQKKESDLDVMVEFNGNIGIQFIDLAEEIESITGLKVDLVSRNGIKDRYFQVIKSDLILILNRRIRKSNGIESGGCVIA